MFRITVKTCLIHKWLISDDWFYFSDGLDFFFGFEPYARKMVDFLQSVVPCRYNTSKKLISHDQNSNTYNYKYVFSVEVVPICKDNVVCLPIRLARSLGMYDSVNSLNCKTLNKGDLCIYFNKSIVWKSSKLYNQK